MACFAFFSHRFMCPRVNLSQNLALYMPLAKGESEGLERCKGEETKLRRFWVILLPCTTDTLSDLRIGEEGESGWDGTKGEMRHISVRVLVLEGRKGRVTTRQIRSLTRQEGGKS